MGPELIAAETERDYSHLMQRTVTVVAVSLRIQEAARSELAPLVDLFRKIHQKKNKKK
jgi:hypothetical protein